MNNQQINKPVFVNAFARLHMGFLDLNGEQGRRFGSLGVGLDAPDTLIEMVLGDYVFGADAPDYVEQSKQRILQYANIKQAVSIKVHREIPRHFGLGSGTQMALAIGAGINRLLNLNLDFADIAHITRRGLRSGIGIGTFANGGLVLDGGRGPNTVVPPIIVQQPFPDAWSILLIFDHEHIGVHGEQETKAFADLKDADLQATQENGYRVIMQALPSLKEQNINDFGESVAALQAYTGDYFAPVQGGRFASQRVAAVLAFLRERGVSCLGQSSWGPTGFAVFESKTVAMEYLAQLEATFKQPELSWLLCKGRNVGARIDEGIKLKSNT